MPVRRSAWEGEVLGVGGASGMGIVKGGGQGGGEGVGSDRGGNGVR